MIIELERNERGLRDAQASFVARALGEGISLRKPGCTPEEGLEPPTR